MRALPRPPILPTSIDDDGRLLIKMLKEYFNTLGANVQEMQKTVEGVQSQTPSSIKFQVNGSNLQASIDGGQTWKTVTLT